MPTGMGSTAVPESEIQEVTVEIGDENPKPSGTAKLMAIDPSPKWRPKIQIS